MYATSVQFLYPSQPKLYISHLYDDWQKEHEVVHMDVEERKYVCIDCSLNSIYDLIKIADQNPIQENVDYNINLKMIHTIHKELCELDAMIGMQTLKKTCWTNFSIIYRGFILVPTIINTLSLQVLQELEKLKLQKYLELYTPKWG